MIYMKMIKANLQIEFHSSRHLIEKIFGSTTTPLKKPRGNWKPSEPTYLSPISFSPFIEWRYRYIIYAVEDIFVYHGIKIEVQLLLRFGGRHIILTYTFNWFKFVL